ncbi:MAG: hypothetical protein R6V40_00480 [Candidatus Moraniibacteriota bacterium]
MNNMNNEKTTKLNIIEIFSIWWISAAFFSLVTVILGIFYPIASLIFALLAAIFIIQKIKSKKIILEKLSRFSYFALGFFIAFAVFLSFNSEPTIFGGRDEGSYSNTAILMNKSHSFVYESKLVEEFFDINEEGKALNFPGFQYTSEGELKSQFLPAYPAWLANFYGLFGVEGFKFANLFPFLTLLSAFYLILLRLLQANKTFEEKLEDWQINQAKDTKSCCFLKNSLKKASSNEKLAFLGATILATCFPIAIFYKFTLSEIFFAALIWLVLHLAFKYFQTKDFLVYQLIFLPLILISFVRIEAVAFIFLLLMIMILKDFNHLRQARYQLFFVITGIALFVSISVMPNFFINSLKNVAEISPASTETVSEENLLPDDWQGLYLPKIFYNYNIAPLFIMAIFSIAFIVKRRKFLPDKEERKFNSLLLLPLIFCFPTFIYLIDANISLDHPWMLRRFVFTIIPIFILYSILFLKHLSFKNKLLFNLIVVFVLLGNIVLLIPAKKPGEQTWNNFLAFKQNEDLLEKTRALSQNFTSKDLVLLSQESSGSGWSLMAEPMRNIFGLQAIYFFNPEDLEEIDKNDFENIYLISSDQELSHYKKLEKKKVNEYKLENPIIQPSKNPLEKPSIEKTQIKGGIYKIEN